MAIYLDICYKLFLLNEFHIPSHRLKYLSTDIKADLKLAQWETAYFSNDFLARNLGPQEIERDTLYISF